MSGKNKRPHKSLPLDEWIQIPPKNRIPFGGLEKDFTVFKENDILFFVAHELFQVALGQKNYYPKLRFVLPHRRRRLRITHGSVPKVCVAEPGVQEMLYRTHNSFKKIQLIAYLNENYDVCFAQKRPPSTTKRKRRLITSGNTCPNCVEYGRQCEEMLCTIERLREENFRLRNERESLLQ